MYNKNLLNINNDFNLLNLKKERFIFFNKDYAPFFYSSLLQICSKIGFKPKVVHQANNIGSIIQLIKGGLGISIVPYSNSKNFDDSDIQFYELTEFNEQTEVLLATPKNENSEISRTAIEFLIKSN